MSTINSTSTTGNILRITGLATGLDVDGTVKKLMIAQQTKIDKANQDKQNLQWKQDAYKDIIKDIKDLQNSFFDVTSPDTNMNSSTNYSAFSVTGNNSAIGTVTAGVGAQTGNYTLKVDQIANSANYASNVTSNDTSTVKLISKLSTIGTPGAMSSALTLKLNLDGGKTINIAFDNTSGDKTVNDLVDAINTQGGGAINASYSELTQKFTLKTAATGNSVTMAIDSSSSAVLSQMINPTSAAYSNSVASNDGSSITSTSKLSQISTLTSIKVPLTFNLDVGGGQIVNVSLDNSGDNKTVNDLLNAINTAAPTKVSASFNSVTNSFSFQNLSGNNQSVSIAAGTTSSLQDMITSINAGQKGNNADVSITPPGESTAIHVNTNTSNNFTYDGVNYNIAGTGTASLSVVQDTQKVYDKVKSFLDKYNTVVSKIYTKITEKKDSSYKPLTDTQKAAMSADQITAWNLKAQTGLLRNDDNLKKMLNDLQQAFTTPVNGVGLQMGSYTSNSFGLDTSSDSSKPYEIRIADPAKFKATIAQNGSQLLKMFTNVSSSTDANTKYSESGIFRRINDIFVGNVGLTGTTLNSATLTRYANDQDSFSSFGNTGNNTLMDQLYQKSNLIAKLGKEYTKMQTAFYNKFANLETAMTKLNSQSSSLTSMMGGGY